MHGATINVRLFLFQNVCHYFSAFLFVKHYEKPGHRTKIMATCLLLISKTNARLLKLFRPTAYEGFLLIPAHSRQ